MAFIVAGATASGKTDYAIELALKKGAYVINADALQIYEDLPILTARPLDKQNVPHFLFGFLQPEESFNVMTWYEKVKNIVTQYGDNYILVGGTVFYLKTWINGGLDPIPAIPKDIKQTVHGLSKSELYEAILKHDPDILKILHPNDTQRLRRALEVKLATGQSIQSFYAKAEKKSDIPIHVMSVEKPILHERIRLRTLQMLKNGAIEEVQKLLTKYANLIELPINKVIGVREIIEYLNHHITKEEMTEKIISLTKQYAKRQVTFCRQLLI